MSLRCLRVCPCGCAGPGRRPADGHRPISPCLWFDDDLEQAVALYTSVFPDSEVHHLSRYGAAGPGVPGT